MKQTVEYFECLVLDLFGVIVNFEDKLVYERIARGCLNPDVARGKLDALVSDPDLIRGRTSLHDIYRKLVSDLDLKYSYEHFHTDWKRSYSEPMPGIRDLLSQLATQCRLVLLSNVDSYYWPTVKVSIPELNDFYRLVLSFEHGIAKPQDEAFNLATSLAGVVPEKCYFVDDKPENIEAACRMGLKGHLFESTSELKLALRQIGFEIE